MTEILPDRDTGETVAAKYARVFEEPFALFEAINYGSPVIAVCPLTELGEPTGLIAIYEVCS